MNQRERALTALRRQVPDKVPRMMSFTPPMLDEFRRRTSATNPADHFDFEVRTVHIAPTDQQADFSHYLGPIAPGTWVNEWGIGHVIRGLRGFQIPIRRLSAPTAGRNSGITPVK